MVLLKNKNGDIVPLSTKIGGTSAIGLVGQSIRYKFSPNLSLLVDAINGAPLEKKTLDQSILDRFKPMFLNSLTELLNSDTDGKFALALGALFGGGLRPTKEEPKKK